jgi:Protein of unknown function (DUF3592)
VKSLLGVVGAVVFFGVAGHGVWRNSRLRRSGGRATAEVIDINEYASRSTDAQGFTTTSHTYKAVLRFTTADGQVVVAEECNGGNSRHARRGQQVPVRYDSANPNTVEINTFSGRGNTQVVVALIAAIAVTVVFVF